MNLDTRFKLKELIRQINELPGVVNVSVITDEDLDKMEIYYEANKQAGFTQFDSPSCPKQ